MADSKLVSEVALSALASDIKAALELKANQATTYTKTETDNLLADKADKSDTYTKEEVDNEVYNVLPTDTASGSIAHITDGGDNIPMKSLESEIVAVESGSGEKSPENPYTISGFDSGVITRCGVNLFDGSKVTTTTPSNWGVSFDSETSILTIEHKNTYSSGVPVLNIPSFVGDMVISGTFGANIDLYVNGTWNRSMVSGTSFTCTSGNAYMLVFPNPSQSTLSYKVQLELGNTEHAFNPYNGNTYAFTFGQTVYGGYFDNKGNLVVTHVFDLNTGNISEGWFDASTGGIIRFAKIKSDMQSSASRLKLPCNIASFSTGNENNIIFGVTIGGSNLIYYYPPATVTNLSDLYTFLSNNNLQVVYPLATPITLSITSQDIPTLLGENNIFSNCGDVEVEYHADIGLYIDKKISSLAQG